ncbi:MAG: 5'-nucleotidase C-terminal domain-containing protein [Elusimicrobiales bacterium]
MNSRRAAVWLLAASVLGCGCARTDDIAVYYAGGAHGRFWSEKDAASGAETGGFAALKKMVAAEKKPHILLSGGDWSAGTPEGALTRGEAAVQLMNMAGYAAAVPGAGEFALGAAQLEAVLPRARFPVLCANVYDGAKGGRASFCKPYVITRVGPVKAGIIGLVGPSAARAVPRELMRGLSIRNPADEARRQAAALARENVKFIIALVQFSPEEDEDALRAAAPGISLIVGGRPALEAGGLSRVLRYDAAVGSVSGALRRASRSSIALDARRWGKDPAVSAEAGRVRRSLEKTLSRVVGSAEAPLPHSGWPDSAAANWAADCLRRWGRADMGIIAEDDVASGLDQGRITLRRLYELYPRDESAVFFKMRGADLQAALGESLSHKGRRLFISGARARLDENGGKLVSLEIDGKPVSANKIYRVCAPDGMLPGGGAAGFSRVVEFANSCELVRDKLRWCMGRQRGMLPPEAGRWGKGKSD